MMHVLARLRRLCPLSRLPLPSPPEKWRRPNPRLDSGVLVERSFFQPNVPRVIATYAPAVVITRYHDTPDHGRGAVGPWTMPAATSNEKQGRLPVPTESGQSTQGRYLIRKKKDEREEGEKRTSCLPTIDKKRSMGVPIRCMRLLTNGAVWRRAVHWLAAHSAMSRVVSPKPCAPSNLRCPALLLQIIHPSPSPWPAQSSFVQPPPVWGL